MNILSFSIRDVDETGWRFDKVNFGKLNLLIGGTSSGKSRMLSTIFNIGRFAVSKEFKIGKWDITFEHTGHKYNWIIETSKKGESDVVVIEKLMEIKESGNTIIVERDVDNFVFEGNKLPKLTINETSISLLKNEASIKPIYEAFSFILKRNFDKDALPQAAGIQILPPNLINDIENNKNLTKMVHADLSLSANLFLLSKYFPTIYSTICDYFISVFPFISEIKIQDLGDIDKNIAMPGRTPRFCVKEKGIKEWIPIDRFSSGMTKVLLILTDIQTLPNGGVYLIDEYENSLGINAIEFLPTYLVDLEKDLQLFVTSHHPYIINKIPIKNWYVFHRNGYEVKVKYGEELAARFGKSKQQAFIQLINDPFYVEGRE